MCCFFASPSSFLHFILGFASFPRHPLFFWFFRVLAKERTVAPSSFFPFIVLSAVTVCCPRPCLLVLFICIPVLLDKQGHKTFGCISFLPCPSLFLLVLDFTRFCLIIFSSSLNIFICLTKFCCIQRSWTRCQPLLPKKKPLSCLNWSVSRKSGM